jgi:sigma-B regulation protein RsbU (phosphoserine phosphatase)
MDRTPIADAASGRRGLVDNQADGQAHPFLSVQCRLLFEKRSEGPGPSQEVNFSQESPISRIVEQMEPPRSAADGGAAGRESADGGSDARRGPKEALADTPTILVVDDAPVNAELVKSILEAEGFRTLTAGDGASARNLSRALQPDLILLDVLMPGETGFETCAQLKSDPVTADIPIIFLSSLDDVKSKVAGLKIGGVDYIAKPVHGEEVLARVRVHLRIRANNRAQVAEQRARLERLRDAQQAILAQPDDYPEAAFAVYFKPLEEAGGDFYDVLPLGPGMFGYFVADFSGHGVSAAFLTSAVKALLRQYAGPVFSPEDTMHGVDAVMGQMLGEEQYLTACYARLNRPTRRLTVVGAGHPPLILVSRAGMPQTIEMESDPLGMFGTATLHRRDLRVSAGDRFFLYSDGLIESSPGGGRREGLERLVEACIRHRAAPLAESAASIVHDICPEESAVQDDLLLLAAEVGE